MKNKHLLVETVLVLSILFLSACNLPSRQITQVETPVATTAAIFESLPTPTSECVNPYFPNRMGDTWEYSGANSAIGAYTRTDTITDSGAEAFSQQTTLSNITYSVSYTCSSFGLLSNDPVQQYAGALLSSSDAPVNLILRSNSGSSLPAEITPGDTWQQTADWDATTPEINMSGRFIFDYTAVGYENVTVPFGSFNALRVDTTIRIEVTGFRILAGTYMTTTWMVPDVGIIKIEGSSHIPGVDFTDGMQLTRFTPGP